MRRRDLLSLISLSLPPLLFDSPFRSLLHAAPAAGGEQDADVVIIGGGLGGCAAALAAARTGCRVVLTEETDWLGGQVSSQAVPPDEHYQIETSGCTASYRELRSAIREYYRQHMPLTAVAHGTKNLNPGGGSVSRICHEPRVAVAALYKLLGPHIASGNLTILLNHRPIAAQTDGDKVLNVTCQNHWTGEKIELSGTSFIDATETGELLPLTGTEYVTGFEAQSETNEPHAPAKAQPNNHQAATWCFPIQYIEGGDFTIPKPEQYDFWQAYVPPLKPAWPGKIFSWTYSNPSTLQPRTLAFDPQKEAAGWWLYRRIAAAKNFLPGAYPGSISLVNWPQNDYLEGNFYDVPGEEQQKHFHGAKQLSLSLMYWMQTEAPRPDGGTGWKGLRLCPEVSGTEDGLAKYPYIRESRRIRARFTVFEQHISKDARMQETGLDADEVKAAAFHDTVGVGSYRLDLHPSTEGDNYIDLASLPFEIPLGALIPQRMKNLYAGCKNLGVTHLSNGCYRLHPVEWNIGESAGMLAAHCHEQKCNGEAIHSSPEKLAAFQKRLEQSGVQLHW
ncbi:FAD-dependent oxidoreductase [Roseimaritima multifibrata]|nr:FAD-dependent oxidoreductase [Roseimaritima multifibrata]